MKTYIKIIGLITLLVTSPTLLGYAIYHTRESAIPFIDVYVFKTHDNFKNWLVGRGVSDAVATNALKVGTFVTGALTASEKAAAQKDSTLEKDPKLATATATFAIVNESKEPLGMLLSALRNRINLAVHSIAHHEMIGRGTNASSSSWNWLDLCKDVYNSTDENCRWYQQVYVIILDSESREILWQGYIAPGDGLLFTAIKNPDNTLRGQARIGSRPAGAPAV